MDCGWGFYMVVAKVRYLLSTNEEGDLGTLSSRRSGSS